MQQELLLFCRTFLAGVCLAVCYDLLRILRNTAAHSTFLIGLQDILYWCAAGLFLFSVIYRENDGVIRIYVLLGTFLGAFVYHAGPSVILVKYLSAFLKQTVRCLGILGKPLKLWRKRLKFYLTGVKIALYKRKPTQRVRKQKNEEKKKKKKESAEQDRHA